MFMMFIGSVHMLIEELVGFSNKYGSDPELVLAGGGNTSAKENGRMWVKGSGVSLAQITAKDFVEMELEKLMKIFEKEYPDADDEREAAVLADLMAARAEGSKDKRPSVETTLHALFEYKFVLHLHPALVNGLTCSKGGKSAARRVIKRDFIWIEQCRPGYILAKICSDKMAEYKRIKGTACDMLLLENHGIFVAGDTVAQLREKLSCVLSELKGALVQTPRIKKAQTEYTCSMASSLKDCFPEDFVCLPADFELPPEFLSDKKGAAPLLRPFTPDHIVYCRAHPLWLDDMASACEEIEKYREKYGVLPKVIMVKKTGVFFAGENEKQARTACALFEDAAKIALYSRSFGGESHMTEELTDFIVNWEVESYRSSKNG